MSEEELFDVQLFDKDLVRIGWIGDPTSLVVTPRHNQQPTVALVLPADHQWAPALNTEGSRLLIHYKDEHASSGMVRLTARSGAGAQATFTWQVADDWRLLTRVLGWQVPGSAITAQSASEYDTRTGPAETVLKAFLAQNLARLSGSLTQPVTIAPDLGRGDVITVQSRMHPLADRLLPLVDQAGIGVTVRQIGAALVVDCYTPQVWPIVLSEDGGTLVSAEWSRQPPDLTRVVVGGPGDGTARLFRLYVDAALEALYGDVVEGYVDARDIKADDPDFEALMAARGAEALAAGAAKAGLSLVLAETDTYTYGGTGVHVGDLVPVELAPGVLRTDVLRAATISTGKEGRQVTSTVGDRTDDPDRALASAIAAVAKRQRNQLAGA